MTIKGVFLVNVNHLLPASCLNVNCMRRLSGSALGRVLEKLK